MRHKRLLALVLVLVFMAAGVKTETLASAWPGVDQVQASSYLVMDAGSGDILVQQNIDEVRAIASITKIVTCMVVLTSPDYDPDRILTVSAEATYLGSPEAARIGFIAGEEVRTWDALSALMVISANDAANVLAENYSGIQGTHDEKIAAFSVKMNAFASAHGANSSNFNNPCGWDREGHVSTARDVAILSGYAMQNDTFRELSSLRFTRLEPTNMHANGDWALIRNINRLVQFGADAFDSDFFVHYDGVKTGTTPQAGYCLVASGVTPDGRRLIGVLLNTVLIADGRAVDISIPMRALLEEGGRIYREANPIVETEAPTEAPTAAPETTPETVIETENIPVETDAVPALVTDLAPADSPGNRLGSDPTLLFVLGGVGVLLAVILFYLLLELRRKRKMRKRRRAARELREMQDIRDTWRNPQAR